MDIAKFFDIGSKKRDLSDESKKVEGSKKIKEDQASSPISLTDIPDEVFIEGLNSPGTMKILFNCLQNLENKVKDMFTILSESKESQIKGANHLQELTKSVDFMSKKIDEYEEERIKKDKKIKDLEKEIKILEESVDKNQQYSRRNCLLIHGVKENNGENTDTVVMNVIKEHLDVDLNEISIDRSHRIGKPRDDEGRPRPIILKLVRHNDKMKIFRVKKKLKGKNISVTESLTKFRVQKLNEAKERYGKKNVWTNDGKIFYKESENDRPKVYYD